ncbi:RICIN domain-containing protein [Kitasatospora sp. NPDC001175]|uniref:RICIN domain-containing protein n=1 Tax=Kitasatospora sp. NPDC001175 TaxID=3157103 RepID=UPI003D002E7F
MTIPEARSADRIPDSRQSDGPTAAQSTHRHQEAVLAYARSCCADRRAAQELANEAWQRAGEAGDPGVGPALSRLRLLAEVRRTAAGWADTGRGSALSAAFTVWLAGLPQPTEGEPSARAALAAAEADSLVLRAFRSLPTARQDELWQCLVDAAAGPSARTSHAGTAAWQSLQDECLKVYASRAPQRACRHLAARLGDHVRQATGSETRDLDRHLAGCDSCRRARADLEAIRTRQRPALLKALVLWPAEPTATAPTPEREPGDPRPGARDRSRRLPRPPGTGRRTGRRVLISLAAVGAGVLAALAVAGVLLTTVEDAGEHPQPADAPTLPAPDRSLPTTGFGGTPPEISSAAMSSDPPAASASAASPTGTTSPMQPAAATPTGDTNSPMQPVVAGLPLVNHGSGLCVGITTATQAAGPLQLQQCTGQATQRWQRVPAGQGSYQLRNTGTGACLDGTTEGGNSVTVTLQACRSDSGRAEQLWRFAPDARSDTFRLVFLPPVPSSDYPAHLLGPQDWSKADPPHPGSLLVHLPNYYNSDNFLFTMG